jgi:hypothetical protein
VLAANHERGAEMDSLDPALIAAAAERMRRINGDDELRRRYCLQAAGYGDALGVPERA